MKDKLCKVCLKKVVQLDLSIEQKYYLFGTIKKGFKLFAKYKICSDFKLDDSKAEIVIEHLNPIYGKCSNCDYSKLNEECTECPNCGKFNYNLSDPYVNKELSSHPEWCLTFCSHLEWSLSFDELNDKSVHNYWCDGIAAFETKEIITKRAVKTKAWIGEDGQGIYQMKIFFGDKSIANFKNGESLIECIPKKDAHNWIFIKPESKQITVILN